MEGINDRKSMKDMFVLKDAVGLTEDASKLVFLDQTQLPLKEVYVETDDIDEICDAISRLKVRGAPAIGVAAALGLAVSFNSAIRCGGNTEDRAALFHSYAEKLAASRPTAVNLSWAVNRMLSVFDRSVRDGLSGTGLRHVLLDEAISIKTEDIEKCRMISENGLKLIGKGSRILTHCNAGHLAVSRYGTALGPVHLALERGLEPVIYVDETRPLLQGARLTAYEMVRDGAETILVCDNMAASLMSSGKIDMVFVGCDRIAANGDVANKIGTCGLAVIASYFGVPFYVLGPTTTYDPDTPDGKSIIIEHRRAEEVTEMFYSERMAPEGVGVYNPAFDVTPSSLVTGYVSEYGLFDNFEDFKKSLI